MGSTNDEGIGSILGFMRSMTLDSFVYEPPKVEEIVDSSGSASSAITGKPDAVEEVKEVDGTEDGEEPQNGNLEEIRIILKDWEAKRVEQKSQVGDWDVREPITMPRDMEDPGYISVEEIEVVEKVCPGAPKRIRSPSGGLKRRCAASRVLFAETAIVA